MGDFQTVDPTPWFKARPLTWADHETVPPSRLVLLARRFKAGAKKRVVKAVKQLARAVRAARRGRRR